MEQCISLIMQELQRRHLTNHHTLAYQSRVGPVQWLQPYTDVTIRYDTTLNENKKKKRDKDSMGFALSPSALVDSVC